MKTKIIFALAAVGIFLGLYSAYVYSQRPPAEAPAFSPTANPYPQGIYANGIIESAQSNGSNVNIYPEVSGPIVRMLANEGDHVAAGQPLLQIDDSVQRATAAQQRAQADAAKAMLDELRAEPRPEVLKVAQAQVDNANASLANMKDHYVKEQAAYSTASGSVPLDDLDNARNAMLMAASNLAVMQRQLELTKAGAWFYDVSNQRAQYEALAKAADASDALLAKYTLRAPSDGVVLSLNTSAGSYVSPQGAYDTYTQGMDPLIVMGSTQDYLEVRCYVDEILVPRLSATHDLNAKMFVHGTDRSVPLTFDRIQPYISPKIELSDQRLERVDVRVLPLIFRFAKPKDLNLYPGQLVDVYVGQKQ